jgi:hypothetical protein
MQCLGLGVGLPGPCAGPAGLIAGEATAAMINVTLHAYARAGGASNRLQSRCRRGSTQQPRSLVSACLQTLHFIASQCSACGVCRSCGPGQAAAACKNLVFKLNVTELRYRRPCSRAASKLVGRGALAQRLQRRIRCMRTLRPAAFHERARGSASSGELTSKFGVNT